MSTFHLKSKSTKIHASYPSHFGVAAVIASSAVLLTVVLGGATVIMAVRNGNTVSVVFNGGHIISTPVASRSAPEPLDVPTPVRNSAPEIKSAEIVGNDPVSEERARAFPNWVAHPFVPTAGLFSIDRGGAATGPGEPNKSNKVTTPNRKVAARSDRWIAVEVIYQDDARDYPQSEIFYDKCTRDFMPVQCYMPPNFGGDILFRDY